MFGRRKKKDIEAPSAWSEFSDRLNTSIDRLNALCGRIDEQNSRLDNLDSKAAVWEKALRTHSDSLEDLLDSIESQSKREKDLEQQLYESRKREEALLDLVCQSRSQIDMIRQRLSDNAAWSGQLAMMERESAEFMRRAGILETGHIEEKVDYEIHEVLEAVETRRPEQDHTVARVFARGMIYCGRVVRKASVSAYRLEGEQKK